MRRVLVILEAGDVFPSGTIRALVYREFLTADGYEVRYVSRLQPGLRRFIQSPDPWASPVVRVFGGLLHRLERAVARVRELGILAIARRYDTIFMSKVASHSLITGLRRRGQARLVLDFGDALWLSSRRNDRFVDTLRTVDAVTTDNEHTAAYVRTVQPRCTVIPDCPQVERFDERRKTHPGRPTDTIVIGWVGTPSTTHNLFVVWEALERLFASHSGLQLRLLGADPKLLPPFERIRWSTRIRYSQAEMVDEVLGMHIGLFPLQDVQAARVRGVLKACVYMAGEVAVVASPVGQSAEFIRPGVNGLLAASTDAWCEALERLIADPALRGCLVANGLAQVRQEFSVRDSYALLRPILDPAPPRVLESR
jgi:glycosyltransferase involved in cell wall biosynthesis